MTQQSTFFNSSVENGIAHLVLARPEKANAMSPDFWEDLPRLVRAHDQDPAVRVVVISAEGKHFTSGMDLAAFDGILDHSRSEPARAAFALREKLLKLQDTFTALEQVRMPVIAAIHGACIGGGIDFISACDVRLSTRDAYFGIEEINIGMTADVGTLQRLPKLIAPGIVRELAFTGRRFSADEALGWGFVNSLHADREAVIEAAFAMARHIASKSPLAIAGIKQALNYARDHSVAEGLDQIATWNSGMLRADDLTRAIQARMARQEAEFEDLLPRSKNG